MAKALKPEEHFIEVEAYYAAVGSEIDIFLAAYRQQIPSYSKAPQVAALIFNLMKIRHMHNSGFMC